MIGALEAQPKDRVIGIIGDGSFVMALNALPSISSSSNAFLIVITNGGYLAIRHTQERFLGSRFDGTWNPGKNDLPSVRRISESLGFRYFEYSMESSPPVEEMLNPRFTPNAATVIEVCTDPSQEPFWSVNSEIDHQTGRPFPLPLSRMTNGFGAIDA
jgi:acetolactate synthase-1/2/3 large subunit